MKNTDRHSGELDIATAKKSLSSSHLQPICKSTRNHNANKHSQQPNHSSYLHSSHPPVTPAPSPIFTVFNRNPTLAIYTNHLLAIDTNLCIHINRYSTNYFIAGFFKLISRLGDGWFWYAMLALSAIIYGKPAFIPVLSVIIMGLIGLAVYKLLKVKTVRPRPYQVHQVIVLGERPLDVFSFPSGHTLQAVLFTAALGSYFPALLLVMLPFAVLVALSRMVLGLHYPTDVIIGAGIGYGLSLMAEPLSLYLAQVVAG